jgi:hypothetical protein
MNKIIFTRKDMVKILPANGALANSVVIDGC